MPSPTVNLEEQTKTERSLGSEPAEKTKNNETFADPKTQATTSTRMEEIARKRGWRPVDEFDGDKSQWRTAEQFLEYGDEIRTNYKKEISELKEGMVSLIKHMKDQEANVREKTIAELTEQKRAAIAASDVQRVEAIEEKIYSTRQEEKIKEQKTTSNSVANAWVEKNKTWFNDSSPENAAMRSYMMVATDQLEKSMVGQPLEAIIGAAEAETKKHFSHRFENPNKYKAQDVEQNQVLSTTKTKKSSIENLSDLEKSAIKGIAEIMGISVDKYMALLKKEGTL